MKVRFLGTGTSNGVPVIGCDCAVCRSDNPKNVRTRASILVEHEGIRVLVDAGPDLRYQALAGGITYLDAVFFTHGHADHTHGIDDLRVFTWKGPLPAYGDERTISGLKRSFPYVMCPEHWTRGRPQVQSQVLNGDVVRVRPSSRGDAGVLEVLPVPIFHGKAQIYGYRFGRMAYLTDCSGIPEESYELLEGVELAIIGALRYRPHPTHFTVEQALEAARRLGVRQTYFTHICHDLEHEQLCAELPANVQPAYDGLELELGSPVRGAEVQSAIKTEECLPRS